MTVAADLRAARALIENPRKWGQGSGHRLTTYCAAEALAAVNPKGPYRLWRIFAKANTLSDYSEITRWNDAPERTHTEVLAAFTRAIAEAEAHQ